MYFCSFIYGCSKTEQEEYESQISEQLDYLYKADPRVDIEKAIRAKDYKFMGFYGYSRIVPNTSKCLVKEFGSHMIKGTSDAIENYEHKQLQALAVAYAEDYNDRMYMHIMENNLSKCSR